MLLEHAHQLVHFDFIIACDLRQTGQELAARGALPGAASADAVWPAAGVQGPRKRLHAGPAGLG